MKVKRDRLERPYRPHIKAFGAPRARDDAHIYVAHTYPAERDDAERVRLETEWGSEYLGLQSYSLLTAYAQFALPQRLQGLLGMGREAEVIAARGEPPTFTDRERLHMIQWLAASQVCMMIEELAALATAVAVWRDTGADIAETYLEWRGNITTTICSAEWERREYWAALVGYPGHAALGNLGLTEQEARVFTPLVDETLDLVLLGLRWAREFFTDDVRRVYARFKHGFSLVSPLSTPVALDTELADKASSALLQGSLLVLDRDRRGPTRLLAMRCTGYDLGGVLQAATLVAGTVKFLAMSLVVAARSPLHRGIALATRKIEPLTEMQQRAHAVYYSGPETTALYRMNLQDDVVRLQRDLTSYADRHDQFPFPLPGS